MTDADEQRTDWFAVAALFMTGLAGSMHFAKLAPIMTVAGQALHLSLIEAGFAVSILGIVGVVFAISTGRMVAAAGLRRSLAVALFGGAMIAGLGALAPDGYSFLASRFLEGFSHLLIVVCAPALMAAYAAPRDKPIVLALWGCFFGLGFAITSVVAPSIVDSAGWRGLLASHAVFMLAVGALVVLALARSPLQLADTHTDWPSLTGLLEAHHAVYRSGAPLLLALTFGAYTTTFLATLTFLGRYLNELRGWTPSATGTFIGTASLVTLTATLGAGFLVRAGVPMLLGLGMAFAVLATTGLVVFGLQPSGLALVPCILTMMMGFGLIPGFVFANVPAVAPSPARAAVTYGAIAQFGNVGTFIGTPLFAWAFTLAGWTGGAIFIAVFSIIGIVLAIRLRQSLVTEANG